MGWLRAVWTNEDLADAVEHASPALARQVRALCAADAPDVQDIRDVRRAILAVARYLRRLAGRATPFGLLAGVAMVSFGARPSYQCGGEHRPVAAASAEWLARVVDALVDDSDLLAGVTVVANSTVLVRGERLVVPYQPWPRSSGLGAAEISLRHTAAVRAAIDAACVPLPLVVLEDRLRGTFTDAAPATVAAFVRDLVRRGVLVPSLHAPSTETDALGHLLAEMDSAAARVTGTPGGQRVAERVDSLREVHDLIRRHNQVSVDEGRAMRPGVADRMRELAAVERHPLALDLRLDTAVMLPGRAAQDVELAAGLLTRLARFPVGAPAWRAYHQRFYERYGIGSLPGVLDVVSDSGIGWPDGYPGTTSAERPSQLSSRDEVLLALAQRAALDAADEVVVDDELIESLTLGAAPLRPPPHLEIGTRLRARDLGALGRGDYLVEIVNVSRGAGTLTGRFLQILAPQDAARLAGCLDDVPTSDQGTVAAQLSFPPLDLATAHVTRAPRVRPLVISLAEGRSGGEDVLTPADLAVGCDGRRMYLAAPARGVRVEAATLHALNLRTHTPPLARFLAELSRAQSAQVTTFDWGAARHLPFLPRLRHGRIILAPACWRIQGRELPGRTELFAAWDEAWQKLRTRRRVPRLVHLADGDRQLLLDLDHPGHRVLLRDHVDHAGMALLAEAPSRDELGWCDGTPHEIVVPVTTATPAPWPPLPTPTTARVTGRGHHQTPGTSSVLLACLYGDLLRQDAILTEHLPDLLTRLGQPPWWFIRYRDPDHHLRLRIALPDPAHFGPTAATVSAWADQLREQGLLCDIRYRTSYPETGRWGSGQAWATAEEVFRADSAAVLTQLRQPSRPHRQALVAVQAVAIATAFTGSTIAAMSWLLDRIPAPAPAKTPRPVFSASVCLADPADGWAQLRAAGGGPIIDGWAARGEVLTAYRKHLDGPDCDGIAPDDVLTSLLHAHFVRACGIDFDDEAIGLYLARSAALSWRARTTGAV
ncbi:lantibiotic dehydratase [Pseudofrankia sp. BMG5.36]|nr:lantibiotic dehydratase [Pseudofrankia sp. BMG5.36]